MFIKRFISAVILLAFAAIALVTGGDFLLAASAVVSIGGTYEILCHVIFGKAAVFYPLDRVYADSAFNELCIFLSKI